MVKNIIFDWAGVISNNLGIIYKLAMIIFREYNTPIISLERFREDWEQPHMLFYHKYIPHMTREDESVIFCREYAKCPLSEPYPDMVNTLGAFNQVGKKMIVLSSSDIKSTIIPEAKKFGVQSFFQEINYEVYDKVKVIKDIIQRNKFSQSETVIIGDTTHEIDAGKKAGILTGAVTWGYKPEDQLLKAKPDYIFRQPGELKQLI